MATYKHIASLIIKYRNNELTDKEKQELEEWCALSEKNQLLFDRLNDEAYLALKRKRMDSIDIDEQWEKISARLPVKMKSTRHRLSVPWKVAAATIVLAGAAGLWFGLNRRTTDKTLQVTQQLPAQEAAKKKAPNRIELKLADGKVVYLDGKGQGQIAKQKNAVIYKQGDWLSYKFVTGNELQGTDYNTITTPKGKTVLLELSDGSKVRMNAASSITFPTAFTGRERKVQITGEVYFEVVHEQAHIPFVVEIPPAVSGTDGGLVEVLGTHFNVNAYNDEGMVKTTLLQGKVKVSSTMMHGNVQILLPGEQAQLSEKGELIVVKNVDTEATVAWTDDQFKYHEQHIKLIMSDIARWYNYEVIYKGNVEGHYSFTISRQADLQDVLQLLEIAGTGDMQFTMEDNKIIVTSYKG